MICGTPWKANIKSEDAKDAKKWNNPEDRQHCPDFDERHVLNNGVTGAVAPTTENGLKGSNCKTEHYQRE